MKPINQTRFSIEEPLREAPGNCFSACIASILELSLSEVPDEADFWKPGMTHAQSWIPFEKEVFKWLRQKGLTLVEIRCKDLFFRGGEFDVYCILSGPSPRNQKVYHAVVAQGNKIVHDPHPSKAGLAEVDGKEWWYELFVPISVAQENQQ